MNMKKSYVLSIVLLLVITVSVAMPIADAYRSRYNRTYDRRSWRGWKRVSEPESTTIEPVTEPEVAPEPEPEVVPAPESAAEPEVVPESEPEVAPEPEVVPEPEPTPLEPTSVSLTQPAVLVGFSSYPRTSSGQYSTAIIDDIIAEMDANGLTIYRMSVWYTVDPVPWVRYFLEHSSYQLIVCRHRYPIGEENNWASVQQWMLNLMAEFEEYADRLWIEPVNERNNNDLATRLITLVDAARDAGYTHRIVANKWTNHGWDEMRAVAHADPLDRFYTGFHFYFNNLGWSSAEREMQRALDLGLHLINTEVGADWNEAREFSQSEVDRVSEFMAWCADHDVGCTVWQRYGLENWDTYQRLNLVFP
jgi:hypothetical protein